MSKSESTNPTPVAYLWTNGTGGQDVTLDAYSCAFAPDEWTTVVALYSFDQIKEFADETP